ncbi:MAG TPA: hypothetical protein VF188_01970 [Longimicrobiales bacterium]
MDEELIEREDLSVYLIAGVPKSFRTKLKEFVARQTKGKGDAMLLDEEFSEWVIARLRNERRRRGQRTAASSALWRAYAALSAARFHLQHQPEEEERVRELRRRVESLWREVSPMFEDEEAA